MKRITSYLIVAALAATVGGGIAHATNRVPPQARRATYALQSDLWGYPYKLRLRHCAPSADVLVELRMVEYRPADAVIVYRCVTP